MAQRVIWTDPALRDLERAAEYIEADSARYARAFVREVRAAGNSLDEFAERGRIVPEFGSPRLRELLVRNQRLIYRVAEDDVQILGLIHSTRDLRAFFQRERRASPEDGA